MEVESQQAHMRDFALEVFFSRWEFAARYNLAGSDAETISLKELLELAEPSAREAFLELPLGYTETFGSPALREVIATTYDSVSAQELLCFAGAEEAIYVISRVLLAPGDHAIVLTPNYQAAETVPASICEVTGVPLDEERGWALDLERIAAAIRPNTKLVSVNFPNNPTGMQPSLEEFQALIDLLRQRGMWLFNDEVYRLSERERQMRLPQVVDAYERGISLNVMSKAYGLPGLRIGWLAAKDRDLLLRCERYKHYLSICNAGPSEALAEIGLRARDGILERNRTITNENFRALEAFLERWPDLFSWHRPMGGSIGFVKYHGAEGVEKFAEQLVEQTGVVVLPSSIYRSEVGAVPENHFRIGFGHRNFVEGLEVFEAWLRARR